MNNNTFGNGAIPLMPLKIAHFSWYGNSRNINMNTKINHRPQYRKYPHPNAIVILFASVIITISIFFTFSSSTSHSLPTASPPPPPPVLVHQQQQDANLNASDPNSLLSMVQADQITLADALYASLTSWKSWKSTDLPGSVIEFIAMSRTKDVCDAVLRSDGDDDNIPQKGVIHVGAGSDGKPSTHLALQRSVKWIMSIEPNPNNYESLSTSTNQVIHDNNLNVTFIGIQGAIMNNRRKKVNMTFHEHFNEIACLNCFMQSPSKYSYQKLVDVYTMDELAVDKESRIGSNDSIVLFHANTLQYDMEIIKNMEGLLKQKRIEFLLFKFNANSLKSKANVIETMDLIFDSDMFCAHLAFSDIYKDEDDEIEDDRARITNGAPKEKWRMPSGLFLFRQSITKDSIDAFYNFVQRSGRYVDVLCIKR